MARWRMSREIETWSVLKSKLESAKAHIVRVENSAMAGSPDVNFCKDGIEVWIERKHVPKAPKPGAILKMPHFTAQQKIWIRRRHAASGRIFVFVQVGREYILLRGIVAVQILGSSTLEELKERAAGVWVGKLPSEELVERLLY